MFDNAVETETTQAATALEKTREQQRMLDQQENKEWKKFFQLVKKIYMAIDHDYVTIDDEYQTLVYTSADKDLCVTYDSGITAIIRIYKKEHLVQKTLLGLKTKLIPKGFTCLVELCCDFWEEKSDPSIYKIDRSQLDRYVALYNEMSQHYLDLLKQKTREADVDVAFRQLVKFS